MTFISAHSEQSLKSGGTAKPCTGYPTTTATLRITTINSLTKASHPHPHRKTTLKIFPTSAEVHLGEYVLCLCFTGSKMGRSLVTGNV